MILVKPLMLTLAFALPSFSMAAGLRCDEKDVNGQPIYDAHMWQLSINQDGTSSKSDLLNTLQIIGRNGLFWIVTTAVGAEGVQVSLIAASSLSETHESHGNEAERIQALLQDLDAITGNKVSCQPIFKPQPATGVHN